MERILQKRFAHTQHNGKEGRDVGNGRRAKLGTIGREEDWGFWMSVALGAKPVARLSIGLSSDLTTEGASGLESVPSLLLILGMAAVFQTVFCGLLKRKLGQEGMVTPVWGSLLDLRFKFLFQMNINWMVYK